MRNFVAVFVLTILFQNCTVSWHAYNNSLINQNSQCKTFEELTKPYSHQLIEKLSLWPGIMNHADIESGESIYGSEQALDMIWSSQNPENCSEAKYIISGGWPYGFASRVHTEGIGLALAIQLGRVYLLHPDGDNVYWETQNPFCREQNKIGLDCFYEPLSKCTIKDALFSLSGDVNSLPNYYLPDFSDTFETKEGLEESIHQLINIKSFNLIFTTARNNHNKAFNKQSAIPYQLKPLVECSPMRLDSYFYWWRAVSATYYVRPNPLTLSLMTKLDTLKVKDYKSCIAMHVRHGDKGIEMKLVDFEEYINAAQFLWQHYLVIPNSTVLTTTTTTTTKSSLNNQHVIPQDQLKKINNIIEFTKHKNGSLFISTEDTSVLQQAALWGKENNWGIYFTNLFDRTVQTAALTWDEQHQRGKKQIHDNLEYFSMIFNLEYALKCEAWVCTLASNTCRIIDEMRATIGGKANRKYVDLSVETCSKPPCIDDGIINFVE
jgi:hypothetical protein